MQRKALGRSFMEEGLKGKGVAALVPTVTPEKEEIREIPIEDIIPNRYQPRQSFDPAGLDALADSLKKHGLIQPISVRDAEGGKFELIAGERRFRAASLAGFSKIPAIIKRVQEGDLMEWALLENLQREDLNPIEKAHAFSRLLTQFSLTQERVAEKMGMDRSSVANFLRLLQLPQELWEDLSHGDLSMGHAKVLLSLEQKEAQIALAGEIKTKGLSVRQAERLVSDLNKVKRVRSIPASPLPEITEVENRLRLALGTKVHVRAHGERGEIRIEYYSLDDLDRILDKLA